MKHTISIILAYIEIYVEIENVHAIKETIFLVGLSWTYVPW